MTEELDLSKLSPKTREEIECGRRTLAAKDKKLSPAMEAVHATTDKNLQAQILGNTEPPRGEKLRTPDRVPSFAESPPVVSVLPPKAVPKAAAPKVEVKVSAPAPKAAAGNPSK